MRYLTIGEVLVLYERIMHQSGGKAQVHNLGALEAALAQPRMTFSGTELYQTVIEKAAVLGFLLITNHPFSDGNKRIGHAAMEVFLLLNGFEITSSVAQQEGVILQVAAGELCLETFTDWLREYVNPKD